MPEVQAVAPAFGVILQVENNFVYVKASDSGGRSEPYCAFLVPVERCGNKFRFIREPEAGQGGARASHGLLRLDVHRRCASPFAFKIERRRWPNAELLLLLLVYVQVRGIGGTTRPRKGPQIHSRTPARSNFAFDCVEAIKQALHEDSVIELRPGLIHGKLPSPDAAPSVTFALASCHYPSDIFDQMPADEDATPGPADASLLHLGDLLGTDNSPTLLLLAGDQVYVDAIAGLFDPKRADDQFRVPYEDRGQSRGAVAVMQRLGLRVETMIDDHEIRDNWEPNDPRRLLCEGRAGYFKFERARPHLLAGHRVWRDFLHGGLPFFLGDTRTEREGRTALHWRTARIMSKEQFRTLCDWLLKNRARPKFVLTPSALLPRHLAVAGDPACALHSDAWDGYPCSQHALFKFACDNEVKGLVFLSGDEHISSFTEATVTDTRTHRNCTFHSIHSSALYAPYPFANAARDDFPDAEDFCFPDPKQGPYRCTVKTQFFERDGFACLNARPVGPAWELQVTFHSANGLKPDQPPAVALRF